MITFLVALAAGGVAFVAGGLIVGRILAKAIPTNWK